MAIIDIDLPKKEEILSEMLVYFIYSTNLVICVFLLLWLIGAYLKIFVFKSLKKRYIILFPFFLSLCAIIFWMFQTCSLWEKEYNVDRQYSFYVEECNYNKILRILTYSPEKERYKLFIFDEVEQKVLCSRTVGGGEELYTNYYRFVEKESRFYFGGCDFFDLPRPVDKEAIARQEQEAENDDFIMIE